MRCLKLILFSYFFLLVSLDNKAQGPVFDTYFNPAEIVNTNLKPVGKQTKTLSFVSRLHLFILLSPECPLCKNYSTVLSSIQKEFKADLSVHGIVPGKAYSAKEISKYANDYKIPFPIYIDPQKEFTNYIKGTVTPEVILMNKQGEVIYRGAIDDWVSELGKKKLVVSNEYLKNAIKQYLKNEPVSIKTVEPKGCLINEF